MIFYFTGTGNSLFAAKALAYEGEEIISIIDALHTKAFQYTLADHEKLGFVFPVYFYTVSDPVLEFVRNLKVDNASFVYAVIPCGASIGSAGAFLKSELKKRGLDLQRVDALVVPDGALIYYDIDSPAKLEKQLEATTKQLNIQSSAWTQFGQKCQDAGKKMQDVGDKIAKVGKSLTTKVTAPIVAIGTAAGKAAIDF